MPDDADTDDGFRTVAGPGECAFEVRGSEFHGSVRRVAGTEAAEQRVASVRAAHPEATHVVPAYRVRTDAGYLREHQDDDGEPAGSAGGPALTVLRRRDLEAVVATVVRYYGGTNLGVGGLARAYGRAVGDAIEDAGVTTSRPARTVTVAAAYDDSGTVRGVLESAGVDFEAAYGERAVFTVRAPTAEVAAVLDRLRSATGDRITVTEGPPDTAPDG